VNAYRPEGQFEDLEGVIRRKPNHQACHLPTFRHSFVPDVLEDSTISERLRSSFGRCQYEDDLYRSIPRVIFDTLFPSG